MAAKSKASLFVKRTKGFIGVFTRSRMALTGILILALFLSVATAAPLLTPYGPWQPGITGERAAPAWVANLPEGARLSFNLFPIKDPIFSNPSALNEWTVSTNQTLAGVDYSSQVGTTVSSSPGSLLVTYNRNQGQAPAPTLVTIKKTFEFPYAGPPARFRATAFINAIGVTQDSWVHIRVFVERFDGKVFNLWQHNITSSFGFWESAPYPLDSGGSELKKVLGLKDDIRSPADVVFAKKGEYTYGVQLTITDSGSDLTHETLVYLDDVNLRLMGSAFGILGADHLGRDLWTQLIYGARISLLIGLSAALVGIGVGLVVGLLSGYIGKTFDEVMMRFTDMILVIPSLPLLLILVSVLGSSLRNLIIVIGLLGWPGFARIVRSQVLSLKERPFIEASKAAGAGTFHIVGRHIFPNIVSLAYVNLALFVPAAILTEAALAWLGLGDPTVMSWGQILYFAQQQDAIFQWWWTVPPGIAIAFVSLSFVLVGYALDDIFNPKLRKRR